MNTQQNSLTLVIAGFSIGLYSDSEIELENGYGPFVSEQTDVEEDIKIECISGLPSFSFVDEKATFTAENKHQKFYSIYNVGTNLGFVIYNQQTKNEIQQIALLDESFTNWKIYSTPTPDNKLIPLNYPMGPIVMHYMTLKADAVMMHASCAFDGNKARIFTGFSGAGKSTMSKIWFDAGNVIINDDRIVIRREGSDYYVYNTPMYYDDNPKKAPLSSIFLISHSPENKIEQYTGALAVTSVMAFSIQNNFNEKFVEKRIDFFNKLCSNILVYKLGFVPDQSIVHFIKSHEAKETKSSAY